MECALTAHTKQYGQQKVLHCIQSIFVLVGLNAELGPHLACMLTHQSTDLSFVQLFRRHKQVGLHRSYIAPIGPDIINDP